jgi:hypothetical protein
MMWRRAAFAVGPGATEEAMLGKPGGSIAKRSRRGLGREAGELRQGQNPERGEQAEDAVVELGEGGVGSA